MSVPCSSISVIDLVLILDELFRDGRFLLQSCSIL
jgi:hypothetical protein